MNRRDFGKSASLVAAAATIAPNLLAQPLAGNSHWSGMPSEREYLESIGWTPEQIAAWERMRRFEEHVRGIYSEVAGEFPQTVPNGSDKKIWQHGAYRVCGRIGSFQEDYIDYPSFPSHVDLSDIKCFCVWRQGVCNKYTNEIKSFASWGTSDADAKCVIPGQAVTVHEDVSIKMSDEEIAQFARATFGKLQEMVVEFHNREEKQ